MARPVTRDRGSREKLAAARSLIADVEREMGVEGAEALLEAWRPIVRDVLELCNPEGDGTDPLEREREAAKRLKARVRWLPHFAAQAAYEEAPRAGEELLRGATR